MLSSLLLLVGEFLVVAGHRARQRLLKALRGAGGGHQHVGDGLADQALRQLVGGGLAVEGGVRHEHHIQVREQPDAPRSLDVQPPGDGDRQHPDARSLMEHDRGLVPYLRCPVHVLR